MRLVWATVLVTACAAAGGEDLYPARVAALEPFEVSYRGNRIVSGGKLRGPWVGGHWHGGSSRTGDDGAARIRGFLGDCRITVEADGKTREIDATLAGPGAAYEVRM